MWIFHFKIEVKCQYPWSVALEEIFVGSPKMPLLFGCGCAVGGQDEEGLGGRSAMIRVALTALPLPHPQPPVAPARGALRCP